MAESNPLALLVCETDCETDDPFGFLMSSSNPEGAPWPITDLPGHGRFTVINEFEQRCSEDASVLGMSINELIRTRADALDSFSPNMSTWRPGMMLQRRTSL